MSAREVQTVRQQDNEGRDAASAPKGEVLMMIVREEIDRAARYGQRIEALLDQKELRLPGDRDGLIVGYWNLLLDYHTATVTLLPLEPPHHALHFEHYRRSQNRYVPPAFVMQRSSMVSNASSPENTFNFALADSFGLSSTNSP